jgi:hypothetical protein
MPHNEVGLFIPPELIPKETNKGTLSKALEKQVNDPTTNDSLKSILNHLLNEIKKPEESGKFKSFPDSSEDYDEYVSMFTNKYFHRIYEKYPDVDNLYTYKLFFEEAFVKDRQVRDFMLAFLNKTDTITVNQLYEFLGFITVVVPALIKDDPTVRLLDTGYETMQMNEANRTLEIMEDNYRIAGFLVQFVPWFPKPTPDVSDLDSFIRDTLFKSRAQSILYLQRLLSPAFNRVFVASPENDFKPSGEKGELPNPMNDWELINFFNSLPERYSSDFLKRLSRRQCLQLLTALQFDEDKFQKRYAVTLQNVGTVALKKMLCNIKGEDGCDTELYGPIEFSRNGRLVNVSFSDLKAILNIVDISFVNEKRIADLIDDEKTRAKAIKLIEDRFSESCKARSDTSKTEKLKKSRICFTRGDLEDMTSDQLTHLAEAYEVNMTQGTIEDRLLRILAGIYSKCPIIEIEPSKFISNEIDVGSLSSKEKSKLVESFKDGVGLTLKPDKTSTDWKTAFSTKLTDDQRKRIATVVNAKYAGQTISKTVKKSIRARDLPFTMMSCALDPQLLYQQSKDDLAAIVQTFKKSSANMSREDMITFISEMWSAAWKDDSMDGPSLDVDQCKIFMKRKNQTIISESDIDSLPKEALIAYCRMVGVTEHKNRVRRNIHRKYSYVELTFMNVKSIVKILEDYGIVVIDGMKLDMLEDNKNAYIQEVLRIQGDDTLEKFTIDKRDVGFANRIQSTYRNVVFSSAMYKNLKEKSVYGIIVTAIRDDNYENSGGDGTATIIAEFRKYLLTKAKKFGGEFDPSLSRLSAHEFRIVFKNVDLMKLFFGEIQGLDFEEFQLYNQEDVDEFENIVKQYPPEFLTTLNHGQLKALFRNDKVLEVYYDILTGKLVRGSRQNEIAPGSRREDQNGDSDAYYKNSRDQRSRHASIASSVSEPKNAEDSGSIYDSMSEYAQYGYRPTSVSRPRSDSINSSESASEYPRPSTGPQPQTAPRPPPRPLSNQSPSSEPSAPSAFPIPPYDSGQGRNSPLPRYNQNLPPQPNVSPTRQQVPGVRPPIQPFVTTYLTDRASDDNYNEMGNTWFHTKYVPYTRSRNYKASSDPFSQQFLNNAFNLLLVARQDPRIEELDPSLDLNIDEGKTIYKDIFSNITKSIEQQPPKPWFIQKLDFVDGFGYISPSFKSPNKINHFVVVMWILDVSSRFRENNKLFISSTDSRKSFIEELRDALAPNLNDADANYIAKKADYFFEKSAGALVTMKDFSNLSEPLRELVNIYMGKFNSRSQARGIHQDQSPVVPKQEPEIRSPSPMSQTSRRKSDAEAAAVVGFRPESQPRRNSDSGATAVVGFRPESQSAPSSGAIPKQPFPNRPLQPQNESRPIAQTSQWQPTGLYPKLNDVYERNLENQNWFAGMSQ